MRQYQALFYPQTLLFGNLEMDYVRIGETIVHDQLFGAYEQVHFTHAIPTSFTHLDGFLVRLVETAG